MLVRVGLCGHTGAGGLGAGEKRDDPGRIRSLVIAVVWPLQRRLQRRLPQLFAVFITAVCAIGCWLIVWGFGRIAQWMINNSARLQGLYSHLADLLE